MTNPDQEGFPPFLMVQAPAEGAEQLTDVATPSTDKLQALAWALYTSGTILETAKGSLAATGLDKDAIKAVDFAIDSYVDLINPANQFLAHYINHMKTGKWPPVTIKMPPAINPKASTVKQVINDIDGAVSAAIVEFQGSPHGGKTANALSALETGLESIVKTIQQYYPKLLA
jgi:hypothetical protein